MSKKRFNLKAIITLLLSVVICFGFTSVVKAEEASELGPGCYQYIEYDNDKLNEILSSIHFESATYDKGSGKAIGVTANRCGLKFEWMRLTFIKPKSSGTEKFGLIIDLHLENDSSDVLTFSSYSFNPVSPEELEKGLDNGEYRIENITLRDESTDIMYANIYIPESAVCEKINIIGTKYFNDTTPPVLKDVSFDKEEIKAGERVKVTATVTDDSSGVASAELTLGIVGWNVWVENVDLVKDEGSANTYSGEIDIPQYLSTCNLDVYYFESVDKVGNLGVYSRNVSLTENGLPSSVTSKIIHVIQDDTYADTIPPVLTELSVEGPTSVNVDDVVIFKAKGTDTTGKEFVYYEPRIAQMTGTMSLRGYNYNVKVNFTESYDNPDEYVCIWPIISAYYDGTYDLTSIDVVDLAGNSVTYTLNHEPELPANISITVNNPSNPVPSIVANNPSMKPDKKTIDIPSALPYGTIVSSDKGLVYNFKALKTADRDKTNQAIFANYYASQKKLKYQILDTKDIYAPYNVSAAWKKSARVMSWSNTGAKAGDLIYVVWYCQEAHDMRFIPATVSENGTVYFSIPCIGSVSTISIVKCNP